MTAREPTEAMREIVQELVWRNFLSKHAQADAFARSLLEQDAAARRDVTEARAGGRRCWLCSDALHESMGLTLARDIDAALRTGEPAEPREVCQKCALKVEQFMGPLKTAARLAAQERIDLLEGSVTMLRETIRAMHEDQEKLLRVMRSAQSAVVTTTNDFARDKLNAAIAAVPHRIRTLSVTPPEPPSEKP